MGPPQGKAIAQFLYLVQQELEASDIKKAELQKYNPPLQEFILHEPVKSLLSKAFEPGFQSLDGKLLRAAWTEMKLPDLPDEFSWGKIGRVYLIRVEDLIGESQELKELFATKQLVDVNESTQQIVRVVPDFDLERYRESLQETYGRLKLNAIDTTYQDYKVKLWRIFIPQNIREGLPPSRYEFPKEIPQNLQAEGLPEADISSEALEQYKRLFLEKPVYPVREILREPDSQYAVILGDPGAGKSSLLQYLALDWTEQPTAQIPLLIELRQYVTDENRPKDFLEFFHQGKRKICELNQLQLHQQLESGNALVMFDGLDEIFDIHTRDGVLTEIIAFTNKYKHVRVIVTSRIVGYNSERLENAKFRHFTLEELNDSQIRDFVHQWHELALVDETERDRADICKRLQTAIKDSPAIRELAGNPLLLTMMAILNRQRELPRKRADLYEESSKVLLYQWDIEYKKIKLTLDDVDLRAKQAMLRRIAYRMQASKGGLKGNMIHRDNLEAELAAYLKSREVPNRLKVAGQLIQQLRERDFILCHIGNDYFAFIHRTFLEYFCAAEFAERFRKRGTKGGLTLEHLQTEVFGKHWQDKLWHEVLRLIIGNENIDIEFAIKIIDYLIDLQTEDNSIIPLLLAADCYVEVSEKNKIISVSKKLLNRLKSAIEIDGHTEIIVQKIISVWQDNAKVRNWLEEKALMHEKNSVREAIARGIASVELSHLTKAKKRIRNLGDVYYLKNSYEKAISLYHKLDISNIYNSKLNLVWSYTKLKYYDRAITLCKQLTEKEQEDQWIWNILGDVYRESGHYTEAIIAYEKAIKLAEEKSWQTAFLWNMLGDIYRDFGHYAEAIITYENAIKLTEKKILQVIFPLRDLGWTYQDIGQYKSAIVAYKKANSIKSESLTHSYLGLVYLDLGLHGDAIDAFQYAIEIDSTNRFPYNYLGFVYRESKRWEDAIKAFEKAIELNPRYANAYRNLGTLFLLQEELALAEHEFNTALQINPYYANGIFSLGLLQSLRGNLTEARVNWKKGLELYGEHAQRERLYRPLYEVALGQAEGGISTLQSIIHQEKPPRGLLRQVLETARLLQRCPEPIDGLSDVVFWLEQGIEYAPVLPLDPNEIEVP